MVSKIFIFIYLLFQGQLLFVEVNGSAEDIQVFFTTAMQCAQNMISESDTMGSDSMILERLFLELNGYTKTISSFLSIHQNLGGIPPLLRTGHPSRPQYNILHEQITHCLSLGMSWQRIAVCFGISRRTLHRHRQQLEIGPLAYTRMYVLGGFGSRNIRIQRRGLRQCLQRLDPVGRAFRRRHGNHKLVRWRMVFHGCVDGFSRTIIYLQCLNNNRASSVSELFRTGVQSFELPLIRCDHGMENTAVARYMLERRGLSRGSDITGRSLNRVVSFHYSSLFTFMENEGILDSTDELLAAAEFQNQWNNHGLSTEGGQTPLQLWQRGVLYSAGAGSETFDFNEDIPPQLETANDIVVPVNEFNVNETVLNRIQETVDPHRDDSNHGIELFLGLVNFLSELYQS
ncbi:hypothetical protein Q5P01_018738 [Channa striata]|uniref:Integrase core domain-containing protein n=1 Tax=Channa striata TaxID=64152 RepID=A0AA88M6B6_CHASR|nr:hypothetical protein Q5P01_018738 [Channa striata]